MEGQGSEISDKIRAAIKAKLQELGSYVDEELPEYVMVMVANKKTKQQMTDDLNLFLGKNAEVFTNWLHEVLDRLQAIAKGRKKPEKLTEKENDDDTSKKKQGHKRRGSSPDLRKSAKAARSSPTAEPHSSSRRHQKSTSDSVRVKKEREESSNMHKNENDRARVKRHRSRSRSQHTDDDLLDIGTNIVGDEYDLAMTSSDYRAEDGLSKRSRRTAIQPPSTERERDHARKRRSRSRSHSYERRSRRERPPTNVVRPIRRSKSPDDGHIRRSVVAKVVRHEEVPENEYDPLHPEFGAVASSIKVPERRSGVPKELQPKPAIFMRAIREANQSVRVTKPGERVHHVQVQQMQLFTRKRLEQMGMESSGKPAGRTDLRSSEPPPPGTTSPEPLHVVYKPSRIMSGDVRLIETRVTNPTASTVFEHASNEVAQEMVDAEVFDESLFVDSSPLQSSKDTTRFVVTLDGAVDKFGVSGLRSDALPEPLIHRRVEAPIASLVAAAVAAENGTDASDHRVPTTLKIKAAPYLKSFSTVVQDEDDEETMPTEDVTLVYDDDAPVPKIMERCRFWPACRLAETCAFHHPTVSCKTFPNCKFGEKCLFIHPNCKFDAFCKNPTCPFTHASRRTSGMPTHVTFAATPVFGSSSKTTATPCKFGDSCQNVKCPYLHPKMCKFGLKCTRSDCMFEHPGKRGPDTAKFKWSATPAAVASKPEPNKNKP